MRRVWSHRVVALLQMKMMMRIILKKCLYNHIFQLDTNLSNGVARPEEDDYQSLLGSEIGRERVGALTFRYDPYLPPKISRLTPVDYWASQVNCHLLVKRIELLWHFIHNYYLYHTPHAVPTCIQASFIHDDVARDDEDFYRRPTGSLITPKMKCGEYVVLSIYKCLSYTAMNVRIIKFDKSYLRIVQLIFKHQSWGWSLTIW